MLIYSRPPRAHGVCPAVANSCLRPLRTRACVLLSRTCVCAIHLLVIRDKPPPHNLNRERSELHSRAV